MHKTIQVSPFQKHLEWSEPLSPIYKIPVDLAPT